MNFDRFNLLSNYLPAEADWGIEEAPPRPRFNSTTTSEYSQPLHDRYDVRSDHMRSDHMRPDLRDHMYSPALSQGPFGLSTRSVSAWEPHKPVLPPTTQSFHKYIRKYLALDTVQRTQLVEKFKYNLVLSNLLDDTLMLSKNEQALNTLVQLRNEDSPAHVALAKEYNYDGSVLHVLSRRYRLAYPRVFDSPGLLWRTVCLIIFLLKQNMRVNSNLTRSSRVQLFKVLLVVATRIVKFKRAVSTIEASKSLRSLDDFMIANCKVNKVLITGILTLKEYDMFSFLNKTTASTAAAASLEYSAELRRHLLTLLDCLLINVKHSIRELLVFSNGEMLEKYCQINNVPLGLLLDTPEAPHDTGLESLTLKLNQFNSYRRLFICQLLTIHDPPSRNFFLLKLCDSFNIDIDDAPAFVSTSAKLNALEKVFVAHTSALDQVRNFNEKFRCLDNTTRSADFANDNVLSPAGQSFGERHSDDLFAPEVELNLNNLIDKLQNLTTSLKYFKKYSQSISNLNDAEEYDEKITIFKLFGSEIKASNELYNICMADYQNDFNQKFLEPTSNSSSRSNSQRNSHNSGDQFSLKAFHTSSNKANKRYSQPALSHSARERGSTPSTKADKRSKRLSTGLQLGLLTVFEEPNKRSSDSQVGHQARTRKIVSYDDKNGNAHSIPGYESFNQAALDALTRKNKSRNSANRFSINSLNSNVSGLSDLLASTQITTDEDDGEHLKSFGSDEGGQGMSKEELKLQLEESFTRIYSLGNENRDLKLENVESEAPGEPPNDFMKEEVTSFAAKDQTFLGNLEKTLSTKTGTV